MPRFSRALISRRHTDATPPVRVTQSFAGNLLTVSYNEPLLGNVPTAAAFTVTSGTGSSGSELLANPTFDVDASNWTGNVAAISRVTTPVDTGAGSLQVVLTGTVPAEGAFSALTTAATITNPNTYRAQARVNAPSGMALKIGIEMDDAAGAFVDSAESSFIGTGTWQTVTFDVLATAGTSRGRLFIYTNNLAQTGTFYIDNASIKVVTTSSPITVSSVAIAGSNVVLTLGSTPLSTDTLTLAYTAGATPVKDLAGNNAPNYSGIAVLSAGGGTPSATALVGIQDNVAGWGTTSIHGTGTLSFFSGSVHADRWIREDRGDYAITWAHANGLKVLAIIPGSTDPTNGTADAYELDNEPYWSGVDPRVWAQTMLTRATQLKADSRYNGKKLILPLLAFSNDAALGSGFDGLGNYTFGGTTKPWVQWLNEGAPGLWAKVDAFGVHPYAPESHNGSGGVILPGGAQFGALNAVRQQLEAIPTAAGKKFWGTEMGWATGGAVSDWRTTEANQSQWLQDFIHGWLARSDTEILFIYQLHDLGTSDTTTSEDHYGLLYDNGNQKPSYAPVRQLATT